MTSKTYIVNVASGNPGLDLDAALRKTVGWMASHVDDMGQHALSIEVAASDGEHVTSHRFDPATTYAAAPDHPFVVAYTIVSGTSGDVVHEGEVTVTAATNTGARLKAADWVCDYDYHYDERIDPRLRILRATRVT